MLLVDDEELVRDVTLRLLMRLEVDVTAADGVESARDALRTAKEPFQLALVDLTLTDGLCSELLEDIVKQCPEAFLAVMSGYDPTRLPVIPGRYVAFLQKPFQSTALKSLLVNAGILAEDQDEGAPD